MIETRDIVLTLICVMGRDIVAGATAVSAHWIEITLYQKRDTYLSLSIVTLTTTIFMIYKFWWRDPIVDGSCIEYCS